jgi:hypothetical protein
LLPSGYSEQPAQLDGGRQLALLLIGGADRDGGFLGNDEHEESMLTLRRAGKPMPGTVFRQGCSVWISNDQPPAAPEQQSVGAIGTTRVGDASKNPVGYHRANRSGNSTRRDIRVYRA